MFTLAAELKGNCCCRGSQVGADASPAPDSRPRTSLGRRALELAGWLIPGTLLAFFPKCPLCVAGYVALATGLGISLTAANYLRWAMLACCLASLGFMAVRFAGRRWGRRVA